ncbi:MAG TPA: TRAP transporter large permease [Geminicoccus sp.]|nr:TRAP transporter large permease [Geminicoccus sp.]HWL69420.1 TRAP transporter large permease [Geminicoccus sp.]
MAIVQLVGGLLALFLLSVPIAVSLGIVAFATLHSGGIPLVAAVQTVFESMDSFSLMAVPFYIIAGSIMQAGGISARLLALANAIVGWVRGGLGASATLTSMFFATISGSSSATTAAIGTITIPAMVKKGYPRPFATAVVAASGELGVVIPPSLPMIIYGLVIGVSVSDLFIAGILPGILIGCSLILGTVIAAHWWQFDEVEQITPRQWLGNLLGAFKASGWALMMPVIILGGIYTGMFTPTEAAVVAIVYGLFVSVFIYRQLTLRMAVDVFIRSAVMSGGLLLIVGFASAFGFVLTLNEIPHQVGAWITSVVGSAVGFLLLVNVLLLVVGLFMETLAAIIILAPILAPIALQYGVDPLHFAFIMIVNLAVGMVTPPVGVNLFIACEIAGLRIDQIVKWLIYFLAILILDVLFISFIPGISMFFLR